MHKFITRTKCNLPLTKEIICSICSWTILTVVYLTEQSFPMAMFLIHNYEIEQQKKRAIVSTVQQWKPFYFTIENSVVHFVLCTHITGSGGQGRLLQKATPTTQHLHTTQDCHSLAASCCWDTGVWHRSQRTAQHVEIILIKIILKPTYFLQTSLLIQNLP